MPTAAMMESIRNQVVSMQEAGMGRGEALKELIRNSIVAVFRSPSPLKASKKDQIAGIAQAAMEGVVLAGWQAGEGCVHVMQAVVDASDEMGLDSEFMIRWALAGLARGVLKAPKTSMDTMQVALEQSFMGAGANFAKMIDEQRRLAPLPKAGGSA